MEIKAFDTTKFKPGCSINLVMRGYDHKYFVTKSLLKLFENQSVEKPSNLIIHIEYKTHGVSTGLTNSKLIFEYYSGELLKKFFKLKNKLWKLKLNSSLNLITNDCFVNYNCMDDNQLNKLSKSHNKYFNLWLDIDSYVQIKPQKLVKRYDWIILGSEYTLSNRKKIYNQYFSFMDFDLFQDIFTKYTELYGLIVIDNTSPSTNPYDKIFSLDITPFKRTVEQTIK